MNINDALREIRSAFSDEHPDIFHPGVLPYPAATFDFPAWEEGWGEAGPTDPDAPDAADYAYPDDNPDEPDDVPDDDQEEDESYQRGTNEGCADCAERGEPCPYGPDSEYASAETAGFESRPYRPGPGEFEYR